MDAKQLKRELDKIADKRGRLTPQQVVDAARVKTHPLHNEFEWNDKIAGEKYRLEQARGLLGVRVDIQTETKVVRSVGYVRDPSVSPKQQGYRSVAQLRLSSEQDDAREAVIAEFIRAEAALSRARNLSLVLGCESEIETVARQVSTVRKKVEEQHQPSA